MNSNVLVLTLESNAFSKMKEDFNRILRRTLVNMQDKKSNEATVTIKLSVKLEDAEVPDYTSKHDTRTIKKPQFDHKISSVMQIKSEESGSLKGEYELVWDGDLQDFVMKPIYDGQTSIFDDKNESREEVIIVGDVGSNALPSCEPPLLESSDDFGDGGLGVGSPYEYDNVVEEGA